LKRTKLNCFKIELTITIQSHPFESLTPNSPSNCLSHFNLHVIAAIEQYSASAKERE